MSRAASKVPRTTPSTWKALLFHAVALYVLISASRSLRRPSGFSDYITNQVGGWYQFLTVLGLYSAIVTMSLALLKDCIPSLPYVDFLKNSLGIVSVPLEGLISLLYWGIKAYDPSLMVPLDPKFHIPLQLDLSLHAIPAALLWLDFLLLSPPFSKKSNPLQLSVILTAAYTSWMEYCRRQNGTFPYPFLGDMTVGQRVAFYSVAAVLNIVLFRLANAIHFVVDYARGRNVKRARAQAQGRSR